MPRLGGATCGEGGGSKRSAVGGRRAICGKQAIAASSLLIVGLKLRLAPSRKSRTLIEGTPTKAVGSRVKFLIKCYILQLLGFHSRQP